MYSCQWHLTIHFGKQKQALDIMKEWGAEKFRSTTFKKSTNRVMTGYIGDTPSHIIDEYLFESLDDFNKALAEVGQPQFKQYSDAIASLVVSGSQQWIVYKLV
jgi:hypothetical protein